jgi:hypothetical protein
MASHFVSLTRGKEGFQVNDYTTGAASSGQAFEFRLDDASGYRRAEVIRQLKALELFFENRLDVAAGFVMLD